MVGMDSLRSFAAGPILVPAGNRCSPKLIYLGLDSVSDEVGFFFLGKRPTVLSIASSKLCGAITTGMPVGMGHGWSPGKQVVVRNILEDIFILFSQLRGASREFLDQFRLVRIQFHHRSHRHRIADVSM